MRRFLFFSLPLLILAMGLFHFAQEVLGTAPDPALLAPEGSRVLPQWLALATWALEALGLSSLFLLIHGRGDRLWRTGLVTGWIAWIFRGPLLVVTVAGIAGFPVRPWVSMISQWWLLYSLCGLLLAGVAAAAGLQRDESAAAAPLPFPEPTREAAEPYHAPAEGLEAPPEASAALPVGPAAPAEGSVGPAEGSARLP